MKGYIYLSISIVSEVIATTMLKFSEGFTILLPSIVAIVGYAISFYCLSLCLKTIPLSLAYAIWSGLGTVSISILGIFIWKDLLNALSVLGILLIIGGIILLNSSDPIKEEKRISN